MLAARRRGAAVVAWVCASSAPASAQTLHPVEVGAGPFLFIEQAETTPGGWRSATTYHVLDPALGIAPQVLWPRVPQGHSVRCQRVGRNRIGLLWSYKHEWVAELDTGRMWPLRDTLYPMWIVDVEAERVWFVESVAEESEKRRKRGRQRLYTSTARIGERETRIGGDIELILTVRPDGFWCISADEPRRLVRIGRDGATTEFGELDPHWIANASELTFSPSGKFVALTSTHDEYNRLTERELVVVDLEAKRATARRERIPSIAAFGTIDATMYVEWLDETSLLVDASSGNFALDVRTGVNLAWPDPTRWPARVWPECRLWRCGGFEFDDDYDSRAWPKFTLRFAGDERSFEEAHVGERFQLSPDDRWAACQLRFGDRYVLRVVDGERRTWTDHDFDSWFCFSWVDGAP